MALLRKLFARKAMDGLSPVSERVFVFNSCLSTEPLEEETRKDHLTSTIIQLKASHPHASIMVLNFASAAAGDSAVDSLLRHGDAAVARYPSRYAGCPSLPLAAIRALLGSCVDWLVSDRQRNILLMHCEHGAWPALALAISCLLVYVEESAPEQATLDAVYGRAPVDLLTAGAPALNPRPSHLRYLQYVTSIRARGSLNLKGMSQEPFVLDCLILRAVPDFDGKGGCRPVVRVHGQESITASPEVLFSTPRMKQQFKQYRQVESAAIMANVGCQVQGDVVIECVHVGDHDREDTMFRVMFNTCFLQSNMMVLTLDDVDLPWNCSREKFQQDFKIEVFFSEVDLSDTDEIHDGTEISSVGNPDEFFDFDEILIDPDLDSMEREWYGETSQRNSGQEPGINTEEGESESEDSDTASGSSEEKGSTTDDDAEFIHEADLTRESGETSQVGSSGVVQSNVSASEDAVEEMPTSNSQENKSLTERILYQGAETSMQEVVTASINEVSNVEAYDAQNSQPTRKTSEHRKKAAAVIIPPAPIIKKKTRKPDIGLDNKKPAKGKILLREISRKATLFPSSSSKNSTSHKEQEIADRSKQGVAQPRRASTLSKEHLKHTLHQQATRDSMAKKDCANDTTTELKQATFSLQTPPSSPPSPPSQELNQENSKGDPLETTKKSTIQSSVKSKTISRTPRQDATTASGVETPRRTTVMKKSLSSPAISQTPTTALPQRRRAMNSLPGVKTTHPSSVLHIAASSSPRARVPSPSSPGRSPSANSKANRAISDKQQVTSVPARLPRRASLGELSTRTSNARSLSPRASRIIQNHPAGGLGSGRSSSPLSPRLSRPQPLPKTTSAVSTSNSKDSDRSGTTPARPTRLSS